jgi:hypothetical protein
VVTSGQVGVGQQALPGEYAGGDERDRKPARLLPSL